MLTVIPQYNLGLHLCTTVQSIANPPTKIKTNLSRQKKRPRSVERQWGFAGVAEDAINCSPMCW